MAKVPVLRTSSKIDPAELAVAQERTEARLTDLFRRRTAAGRRAGQRTPIIVDGVELIGSPDEPPLTSSPAVADDRPPTALPGAPSEPPLGDLVDVVDPPATEVVSVMVPPPSSALVGVMAGPDHAPAEPAEEAQLVFDDDAFGWPSQHAASAPRPPQPAGRRRAPAPQGNGPR